MFYTGSFLINGPFLSKLSFWYFSIPLPPENRLFFLLLVTIVTLIAEGFGYVFYRDILTKEISQQLYGTLSKIDDNISPKHERRGTGLGGAL